jgi:ribosomal protein L13E
MTQVVTPQQIENRLYTLSKEVDQAHADLVECETKYHLAVAQYEIGLAKTRLEFSGKTSPTGRNYTVGEREDMALIANQEQHLTLAVEEAKVKAARANVQRLQTQVKIAQSMSASVRASMEIA